MKTPTRFDDTVSEAMAPPSRWSYPVENSMTACEALAVILDTLLRVMTGAEPGVIEARDADSLHDYRVAVRRTRSALSLFGKLLAPNVRRGGRKLFKDLGRRTTYARDLDVLLLEMPGYFESAAPAEPAGVEELESRIVRSRESEYDAVCRWLEGEAYRSELGSWRADLEQLAASGGELFRTRAAAAIRKAIDRTEKLAGILRSEDSEVALHRLRIRYKKLRYALEFARPLTPGGQVDAVIVLLKELQDQLGEHQDLLVHGQLIAKLGGATPAARWLGGELAERRMRLRKAIEVDASTFESKLAAELDQALASLEMR